MRSPLMKTIILLLAIVLVPFQLKAQQNQHEGLTTFYYNAEGELTMKEFATHYRIARIDTSKGVFTGEVMEYDMDDHKISQLVYDDNGAIIKGQIFDAQGKETHKRSSFPDSVSAILENKAQLKKSHYIKLSDYSYFKHLLSHETDSSDVIYSLTEYPPKFHGGIKNMYKVLWEHFLTYPESAKSNKIEGQVILETIIQPNGEVTHVKIHKGINPACDTAAYEAVKNMPDWIPAIQRGKKVAVKYYFPVKFDL